jgi:hypothetical protein
MSVVSAPTALAYSKTAVACKRNFAIDEVQREKDFFINNLLVRIHFICKVVLVDRPCAMGRGARVDASEFGV